MAAESKHDVAQALSLPGRDSSRPLSPQDPAQGSDNTAPLSISADPFTLALQGSLNARALREAGRRIKDARREGKRVALDLGEVTLMDRAALRFLLEQLKQGAELTNCPAYITHWISRETHESRT
jgi:ABC-type transporter Mla MlaB component